MWEAIASFFNLLTTSCDTGASSMRMLNNVTTAGELKSESFVIQAFLDNEQQFGSTEYADAVAKLAARKQARIDAIKADMGGS